MTTVPIVRDFTLSLLRRLLLDPINYLATLHQRYGEISCIERYERRFYLCYSPAMAEHILVSNQDNYAKVHTYTSYFPVFGENSLFITNHMDQWQKDRKLAQTVIDMDVHGADYVSNVVSKCMGLVNRMRAASPDLAQPAPIPIASELNRLLFDIVQNTLFCEVDIDANQMAGSKDECHNLLAERSASLNWLWLPFGSKRRHYEKLLRFMEAARARLLISRLKSGHDFDDLLGAFLHAYKITNEDSPDFLPVAKQMLTFLIIGQGEPAATLMWALVVLARHPETAEIIAAEMTMICGNGAPTYEHVAKLEYTQAFLLEILRLHPPLFMILREAINNDTLLEHHIPAGATVALPICRIHRHPEYWDRPDDFLPERFLGTQWGQANPFAYIPFAAGKRNCIGRNFILPVMVTIIGLLVRQFRFSLPPSFEESRDRAFIVYDRPHLGHILVQSRY